MGLALVGYAAYLRFRSAQQATLFEALSQESRCLVCEHLVTLESDQPDDHYRCPQCQYEPKLVKRDPTLKALDEVLRSFARARAELDAIMGGSASSGALASIAGPGLGGALVSRGDQEERDRQLRSAGQLVEEGSRAVVAAWRSAGIPGDPPERWTEALDRVAAVSTGGGEPHSLRAARQGLFQVCTEIVALQKQRAARPELWAGTGG